jgi:hypothetical protein
MYGSSPSRRSSPVATVFSSEHTSCCQGGWRFQKSIYKNLSELCQGREEKAPKEPDMKGIRRTSQPTPHEQAPCQPEPREFRKENQGM